MSSPLTFVGVDVGTGSVRAALVNDKGQLLTTHTLPITVHNPLPDYYEQSSQEIWSAVCQCVKAVVQGQPLHLLNGIGFDATCSLVVSGPEGAPLSVDPNGDEKWDVVMWMDHRAKNETSKINQTGHSVLEYVGGSVSVEMQTPKLLWLKKNLGETFRNAQDFFDLSDFLTWKATGKKSRSLCSTVCKWTHRGKDDGDYKKGWDKSYFDQIGLGELANDGDFARIGSHVSSPGQLCGQLSRVSAQEMGLDGAPHDIPVAAAIIDAHAGALGMLATLPAMKVRLDVDHQLGLICGTSTCHMVLNKQKLNVPGVWGPYYGAILPDRWLHEGGQSAVGSLIDHIIHSHPAYDELKKKESAIGNVYDHLEKLCFNLAAKQKLDHVAKLTCDLHVWPDFHGNRSPEANPELKGAIVGLTLDKSPDNLAILYLATIQALAYGTKHIVEQLTSHGHEINVVTICGGLSKSKLFVQTHADVLGLPVMKPLETESVLLGSAILAATASGKLGDMNQAIEKMSGDADTFQPHGSAKEYHEKKYMVFLEMLHHQVMCKRIMHGMPQVKVGPQKNM